MVVKTIDDKFVPLILFFFIVIHMKMMMVQALLIVLCIARFRVMICRGHLMLLRIFVDAEMPRSIPTKNVGDGLIIQTFHCFIVCFT